MKAFLLFAIGVIILVYSDTVIAQTGVCSSSLVQATVSNLNNQIATYVPSLSYDPANNRFVASIFNNVQVISQSQCSNLIGNSAPTPGITSFSIYLSCKGPENNGNGITGGIQLPITNASTTAILNVVNIPVGSTYSSIPIRPHNSQASLANRVCTIQLQATLFAILGGGYCQACYNVPIVSIDWNTGASGDSQPCSFGDLTCYNNFDILWRSTLLWIIVMGSTYAIAIVLIVPIYTMTHLKRVKVIQHKELMASKETNFANNLDRRESIRMAELAGIEWVPGTKYAAFNPVSLAPQYPEPSKGVRGGGKHKKHHQEQVPTHLTDEDVSDDQFDQDEQIEELIPPPQPKQSTKTRQRKPHVPTPSSSTPASQPYPTKPPVLQSDQRSLVTPPEPVQIGPSTPPTVKTRPSTSQPRQRHQQPTNSLINPNIAPKPMTRDQMTDYNFG